MGKNSMSADDTNADTSDLIGAATGGNEVLGAEQMEGMEAVKDSEGNEIAFGPATSTVVAWCAERVSVDDDSAAAAMEAMIARVLNSTTPDEILGEDLTVKVDDILGQVVLVTGVRIGMTEFQDGFPFYALIDCEYGNPRVSHVVTVGAFKVLAQLFALDRVAEYPYTVKFKRAEKPTRAGYYPISLVRAV